MNTQNPTTATPATALPEAATADQPGDPQRPARRCGPRGCGAGPRPGDPHTGAAYPGGPKLAASWAQRRAPVNIEDTPAAYILSLYADGLDKSALRVSTQDDLLSIRYQPQHTEDGARRFTRRERAPSGFERSFGLNAKVRIDDISATYVDGVLTVQLPKMQNGGA